MARGRPALTTTPRIITTTRWPHELHTWLTKRAMSNCDSLNNELMRLVKAAKDAENTSS